MWTRVLVALALLCGVAHAQPATIYWRPPTGCTTNQGIVWNGSTWVCGGFTTAGNGLTASSGTLNVVGTTGGGLTVAADSIGLLTSCSTNEILKWSGSAWACAADDTIGGGAVTGTGTTNVISKWTSSSVQGDSLLSDNGTTLAYNTNKFTVVAASGNATVAGSLAATGAITDGGNRVFSVAGSGLTSSTSTVTLALATQDCSPGSFFDSNTATGTFTCVAEVGDITEVTAGAGLTGTASSGPVSLDLVASSDFSVGADLLDLSTAVTAPGSLTVATTFSVDGASTIGANSTTLAKFGGSTGYVYLYGDTLNFYAGTNGSATGYLNYFGYAPGGTPGITQFRDMIVADGKGATVATFTGSSKNVTFASTVTSTGLHTGTAGFTTPADYTTTSTGSVVSNNDVTAADDLFVNDDANIGNDSTDVLDVNGDLSKFGSTSGDGAFWIANNEIGFEYATNATATGYISWTGYQHGTSQFRDTVIGNGKGAAACTVTGSTKVLNCVGGVQVNGTSVITTANVTGTAGQISKFSSANSVGDSGIATSGGNELHFQSTTNSDDGGYINFYSNGTSGSAYFRDLIIADGKGATVATFDASDKSLAVVGNVSTNGIFTSTTANGTTAGLRIIQAGQADWYIQDAASGQNLAIGRTGVGNYTTWNYSTGALTHGFDAAITGAFSHDGNGTYGNATTDSHTFNGGVIVTDTIGTTFLSNNVTWGLTTYDDTAQAAGVGGIVNFQAKYTNAGAIADGAQIKLSKTNGTDGNYSFDLVFGTRANGGSVAERMRIASDGALTIVGTITDSDSQVTIDDQLRVQNSVSVQDAISDYDSSEVKISDDLWVDGKLLSETQLNDHTRGFEIFEEFLSIPNSVTTAYTSLDSGFRWVGGYAAGGAESNRPGLVSLRAYTSSDTIGGAAAPRNARVVKGGPFSTSDTTTYGRGWFAGGGTTKVAGEFEIVGVTSPPVDDSDSYTFHIGLIDTNTATGATSDFVPNGIYCRIGTASSNIQVCTSKADTQSCTDTSPTIAIAEDKWYRCAFTVNADATSVSFTVTNVTDSTSGTATRTTQIPNTSSNECGLGASVDSIDTGGTGHVLVDYLWMDQTFTTAR